MSDLDTLTGGPRLGEAGLELDRIPSSSPDNIALIIRHRRRLRMLRFIVFETIAISVMVASAIAGISIRFAAESLTPIFRVLPVGAAIVAAILPIILFGHPERRNRARRDGERKARD